jgi:hypothetical protein
MAMSSLPTYPLLLFGIIEPVMLVWAYIINLTNPQQYYLDQAPTTLLTTTSFPAQALSTTLQLGNVLLLLAAIALICCFTPHTEISRRYLIAVALADLGHIYATYASVGEKVFWDLNQWNQMMMANVGVSIFLHVQRWMTVMGMFGRLGGTSTGKRNN